MDSIPVKYVSTKEVSAALGVSVSTVKRWVDRGILHAHKTAGGHRKLLLSDVVRMSREQGLPNVDLSLLYAANASDNLIAESSDLANQLRSFLELGSAAAVTDLLLGQYRAGRPIDWLADNVVAPAMRGIGDGWECGILDVMHEHRASLLCTAALHTIKAAIVEPPGGPRVVVATPAMELHMLVCHLIQMLLSEMGWSVTNLGGNTPAFALEKALEEIEPQLLCISVTHIESAEQFIEDYKVIAGKAKQHNCRVAMGGQAMTPAIAAQLSIDFHGENLRDLSHYAQTFLEEKTRPERGRPINRSEK